MFSYKLIWEKKYKTYKLLNNYVFLIKLEIWKFQGIFF